MTPSPQSPDRMPPTVYRSIPTLSVEVVEGLKMCGVAAITDTLGIVSAPQQMMHPEMVRRTTRCSVAGQAVTVAGAMADNLTLHAALRVASPGTVLVITAGGAPGAQWGDLVAHAASSRGVAAVVVDGACRDIDAIETLGFPVWSTMVNPLTARKDVVGWVNMPVTCAGVYVRPGDIVVADGDGVVVVAHDSAEDLLRAAKDRVEEEARTREKASQGVLPGDVSGLYERLDQNRTIQWHDQAWSDE